MSYNGRESTRINAKEPPLGQYVEEANYVVFKEDDVVKAKDGSTGAIAFQNIDASIVIQNTLDALTTTGGKIFIKTGMYEISTTLSFPDTGNRIVLEGMGMDTQLKLTDGANTNLIEDNTSNNTFFDAIRYIYLVGNKANNTSGKAIVTNGNVNDFLLQRVFVEHFPDSALSWGGGWALYSINCIFEDCGGGNMVELNTGSNRCYLVNNRFSSASEGKGLYVDGSQHHIVSCEFEENYKYGIYMDAKTTNIIGGFTYANSQEGAGSRPGIRITSRDSRVSNIIMDGGDMERNNIYLATTSDVWISNCRGRNTTGPTFVDDGGTRNVINGLGKNAGDPSTTGDWNGHGREGVVVRDTTNGNTYIYNNGKWSQIASA